jgi:hypothetical protein
MMKESLKMSVTSVMGSRTQLGMLHRQRKLEGMTRRLMS